jgi:hypothetical protein
MSYNTHDTILRFFERFKRDELAGLPPDERQAVAAELEARFGTLLGRAAGDHQTSFADLIGLGPNGPKPFGDIAWPNLVADFDDAVVPSQLHAAAELYYICQLEIAGVFRVAEILRRLFHEGRMRIQRGPGARGIYIIEKQDNLRYQRKTG